MSEISEITLADLEVDAVTQQLFGSTTKGRGAAKSPLVVVSTRELTSKDLIEGSSVCEALPPSTIKSIRHTHHRLARLIASGMQQVRIAEITGYSQSRISVLLRDPAFVDLVSSYQQHVEEAHVDVERRLQGIMLDATEELHQRLAEEPESFTNNGLLEVVKTLGDRAGHSPIARSQSQNLHVHTSSSSIKRLKEAVKEKEAGTHKQIGSTQQEVLPPES